MNLIWYCLKIMVLSMALSMVSLLLLPRYGLPPVAAQLQPAENILPPVLTQSLSMSLTPTFVMSDLTIFPHAVLTTTPPPPIKTPAVTTSLSFTDVSWYTPSFQPSPRPTQSISSTARFLFIDQAMQTMYVFSQGVQIRAISVSTGLPTNRTLTKAWSGTVGDFTETGRVNYGYLVDYRWHLYRDLYGNILIHDLPYTKVGEFKNRDQPEALGMRPSSHGCIRIAPEDAAWLKSWNPTGATIQITPWPGPIKRVNQIPISTAPGG